MTHRSIGGSVHSSRMLITSPDLRLRSKHPPRSDCKSLSRENGFAHSFGRTQLQARLKVHRRLRSGTPKEPFLSARALAINNAVILLSCSSKSAGVHGAPLPARYAGVATTRRSACPSLRAFNAESVSTPSRSTASMFSATRSTTRSPMCTPNTPCSPL